MTPEILAVCETLNLCIPPGPGEERVIQDRYAAFIGARAERHWNIVQRVRVATEDVEATVAEVRAIFRAHGRSEATWEIGPSSAPSDLEARLVALGMTPDDEPDVAGMVLSRPLGDPATQVTVKPVETLEDFRAQAAILRRGFGGGEDPSDEQTARDFEEACARPHNPRFLASIDGQPVAASQSLLLEHAVVLGGAATLPEARGKGAYRAMIAERWRHARERGTPVLVVQAGAMSRPILERLGFETVARVRVLVDRFAGEVEG